jgi:Icc-related predicted phosphoesterase
MRGWVKGIVPPVSRLPSSDFRLTHNSRLTTSNSAWQNVTVIRVAATADFHTGPETEGTLAPLLSGLKDEADLLLLGGDLTQSGQPAEAEILIKELASAGVPIVAVLGNHDYHADQAPAITSLLREAGVHVLDRSSVVLDVAGLRVAIAGTKGFGGGFGAALADNFGEREMKAWISYAEAEADALENVLSGLVGDVRLVLLHYAPAPETLNGERLELYPFLGNSLLGDAIDRSGADLVLHGHAHHGSIAGSTPSGVPIRNVARSVIRRPYVIFDIDRDADPLPRRVWRRTDREEGTETESDRQRQRRSARWLRRQLRLGDAGATPDTGEER